MSLGNVLTAILFLIILLPLFVHINKNNKNITYLVGLMEPNKAETEIIKLAEKKVPKNCLVIANIPQMLVTADLNVIDVGWWEGHKNNFADYKCRLFFKDFTCCSGQEISTPDYLANCAEMGKYNLIPFLEYSEKDYTFGFYKPSDI